MSQTDWQADYFDTGIGFAVFYVIIVFVWRGIALQNAWSEMVVEGYPNVYVWHGLHHHLFGIILKEEDNAIIVGKIRFHFFPRWDAIIGKYRISKTELVKHGNHWSIATDLSTVNAVNNPLIEENH